MNRSALSIIASAILSTGLMVSCSNDDSPAQLPGTQPTEQETEKPTDFKYIELTSSQKQTNAANRNFAYEMLSQCVSLGNIKNPDGNIFISPLGMSNIMTMLANGADKQTLEEITSVLGADLEQLNSFYSLMSDALPAADNQVKFSTDNSIWIDNSFHPSAHYMTLIGDLFHADSFTVKLNTVETKDAINQWCSEKTKGMIPEFLKDVPRGMMFLANALYFNGKWTRPFDAAETDKGIFNSSTGKKNVVDMMHGKEDISYERLQDGELISITYGNKTYSFNIYLPSEGVSIEEALASSDKYLTYTPGDRNCFLSLPKLELDYSNDNMREIAETMGIKRLFNTPGALSQIADNLCCNFLKQVTKLKVDEAAAEAAGVTAAGMMNSSGEESAKEPAVVNVNRPFIFSITETTNNIILFAGVVREI